MVSQSRIIPASGLGKVQVLPYSMWNELKMIKHRDAALDFLLAHRETEKLFERELGEGAVNRIIKKNRFKDNADRDFADEVFKSCVLRAAGSAKASWMPWHLGNMYQCQVFGTDSAVSVEQNRNKYSFSIPYGMQIDSGMFENLKNCAQIVADAIDPCHQKRILRADFTLEKSGDRIIPWLTDFGESQLTFVVATQIHKMRGCKENLVSRYMSAIDIPQETMRVWLVSQSAKTYKDMPYEIDGITSELEGRGHAVEYATLADFLRKLESGLKLEEGKDIVLRYFRQASQEIISKIKAHVGNPGIFIDNLDFIPLLQKFNVNRRINLHSEEIEFWVSVPKSSYLSLAGDSADTCKAICRWAKASEVEEIVLKPGNARMQPNAFFYRLDNPHHLGEMERCIRKMKMHGVTMAVAEEMVGNGAIDGKKAELRLWIFRQ